MKKKLFGLMVLVLVLLVLCLAGAAQAECEHQFAVGNCTNERYCYNCEEWITTNTEHSWGAWNYGTGPHHARYCTNYDCIAVDFGNHYGGSATCTDKAVCTVCGGSYGEVSPNAHDWGEWEFYDDDFHSRSCRRDPWNHYELGEHTGGTPTCKESATCTVCGNAYRNFSNHADYGVTEWRYLSENNHYRLCLGCNTNESVAAHNYGDATCETPATCSECKATKGEVDKSNHVGGTEIRNAKDAGEFTEGYTGDTYCKGCGDKLADGQTIPATHVHSYSDATCTTPATCSCGATSGEALGHAPGAAATCTTDQLCTREGCGAVLTEKLGHDWGNWADNGDGTHTRICGNDAAHTETADCTWGPWVKLNEQHHERRCTVCNAQEVEEHTGGTATCSEPCTCDVCGDHYGSPDSSGLTGHPNPTIEVLPATCLIDGYYHIICDVPGCSAPFTEIILPAYGQHLYNYWNILGDCEHHTACDLCGEDASVGCTLFGMLEGETLLTVCPVCGDFGETPFEVLIAREDVAVPIGTLLVRGLKAPIPDALWGFTVAGVYGGEVVDIHGTVTVTLPVDLTELDGFTVVRVDMVDGEEIRTEIPFALEDGLLTIETDTAGLFLLVSAN